MARMVLKAQKTKDRELKYHAQYLRVEDAIELLISVECYYNNAFGQILTNIDFDLEITDRWTRLKGKTGSLKELRSIEIFDYDIVEVWADGFDKPKTYFNKGSMKQQRKAVLQRITDCLRDYGMGSEDSAAAAGRIVLMIDEIYEDQQKGDYLRRLQLWQDWKLACRAAEKPWSVDGFVREVWGPAVRDRGFTQKDFKARDPVGYTAFHSWCKYHRRSPGDFIPSSLIDPDDVVRKSGGQWPTHGEAIREVFRSAGAEGTALYRAYKARKRRESEARARARKTPKSG